MNQIKAKWDFIHEIGRKIIHLTILVVLALYITIQELKGQQAALMVLTAILIIFFILEYFRLELNWKMPFFSTFIRPKEENRMYGVIFFLAGTIISLAVYDFSIAITALLMTTFGDMAAALFGKRYGTNLIFKNKTYAGFFAELSVNLIIGIIVVVYYWVFSSNAINIYIPILMAFAATIIETLLDEMDDNLIVPIFSGFVGQIVKFLT